jgi:signal transduction histidine kinase
MFNSLRTRLTVAGLLLAVPAVGVTALVVANTTSADLINEFDTGANLQTSVLSELTTYAVVNGTWSGVEDLVRMLAEESGLRIALTDLDGFPFAESSPGSGTNGMLATAVIDPATNIFGAELSPELIGYADIFATEIAACFEENNIMYSSVEDEFGLVDVIPEMTDESDFDVVDQCYQRVSDGTDLGGEIYGDVGTETARPAVLFMGSLQRPSVDWSAVAVVAAGVVAALAIAAFFFSRLLSNPVTSLTDATRRIRSGDLTARVAATDTTEIGELAVSFNEMADELQGASDRRRRFTSDVAHELRTPLANITSHVQALIDGVEASSPEVLEIVQNEVDHMATLVGDLQQLTLVDEGQLTIDPFDVVLSDVIDQVIQANERRAVDAGVSLVRSGEDQDPIHIDPIRIRQAIDNLVANAIRHTPESGAVTIAVEQHPTETVIAVRDTGPGIPKDFLGRVFERFSRSDQARGRATGGSGLGLPIARELVRAHGGELTAENLVGGGAQFTIRLPRHPE